VIVVVVRVINCHIDVEGAFDVMEFRCPQVRLGPRGGVNDRRRHVKFGQVGRFTDFHVTARRLCEVVGVAMLEYPRICATAGDDGYRRALRRQTA
jgi:hypothetical protein